MGRILGAPLRTARRPRRRAGRPLRRTLIEEPFDIAGRELTLLRPPSADDLIDEEAFDADEFMPYWAELWPSGVALARVVGERDLTGERVLELGAGLGLPSLAAALRGADVLATDWAQEAVALLRKNAARNGIALRTERVRWDDPGLLLAEAPWDVVLGADLLYEERNAKLLLELLPRLGGEILLAEPGRPAADAFLARWNVEEVADRVYRLR
ncbi:MAG: class I SAM-dependent methyltransferase [Gaiellaceae bacterium]